MNKKSIVLTITTLLSFSGMASAAYVIQFNNSQSKGMIPEASAQEAFSSCKDILDNGQSTGDGVYTITVNEKEFDVYCDMTSAGGGWTMVVAQFEDNPVLNWNEGLQADYDPSLINKKGFALSTSEIPNHTETAFGKDLDADFIDFYTGVYSTGNIDQNYITNSGRNFNIHRNSSHYHSYLDPDNTGESNAVDFNNALTFDVVGRVGFKWTFSPNSSRAVKGYAMNGNSLYGSYEYLNFAWTIWVR